MTYYQSDTAIPGSIPRSVTNHSQTMTQNNADAVEIDRETLSRLRAFADAHYNEYGDLELAHAIIDSGISLGLDDPTPSTSPERMDLAGLLSWPKYDESDIENYLQRYREHNQS